MAIGDVEGFLGDCLSEGCVEPKQTIEISVFSAAGKSGSGEDIVTRVRVHWWMSLYA